MRPRDRIVLIIFAVAVLYGLAFAYPRQWTRGLLINDEMWYAHLARNVAEGQGYVTNTLAIQQLRIVDGHPAPEAYKQSGYSLMVAAVWSLFGVGHRSMLLVAIIGFGAAASAVYAVFRAFGHPPWLGTVAAAVFIGTPAIVSTLVAALPESWFVAVFLVAVCIALRPGIAASITAGVLFALATIIKGHAIVLLPVFLSFLLFGPRGRLRAPTYLSAVLATLLLGAWLLPAGSVRLFSSGDNYAQAFLIGMESFPTDTGYNSLEAPPAFEAIRERPLEYAVKYARMVSRTKVIVDGLTAPSWSGIFFPMFVLATFLLPVRLWRSAGVSAVIEPTSAADAPPSPDRAFGFAWLLVVATMLFFWALYPTMRFYLHVYPLMWLVVLRAGHGLATYSFRISEGQRRALVAGAISYFLVYPPVLGLWQAYRDPFAYLGRMLAVRSIDYQELARELPRLVPDDGVIVSSLAHEIDWLTGRRTIGMPADEDTLRYVVDRYDVAAVLEHPLFPHDWRVLEERYELIDRRFGNLWVRRPLR